MTQVKVLFVCLGNICRSPLAYGVAKKMAAELAQPVVVVDSAGTGGHHAGSSAHHKSVAVARKHGVDISKHRARKVRKSDFEDFDFIVAMDASNLQDLKRKCPSEHAHKLSLLLTYSERHRGEDVPDPYYGHPSFEAVYAIVEDGVRGFFSSVLAPRPEA
jgi:protein-tyrosine phosphatase